MSTHNICFHGEIRKIFIGYPPLSRPMRVFIGGTCQTARICRLFESSLSAYVRRYGFSNCHSFS